MFLYLGSHTGWGTRPKLPYGKPMAGHSDNRLCSTGVRHCRLPKPRRPHLRNANFHCLVSVCGRAWGTGQALAGGAHHLRPPGSSSQPHPGLHEPALLCMGFLQHLLHLLNLAHVQTAGAREGRGRESSSNASQGFWSKQAAGWRREAPGHVVRGAD